MLAFLNPYQKKGQEQLLEIVGQLEGRLEGERNIVRYQQSNLGQVLLQAWNQLCTTVPFLQRNEYNKQLEINRQNRLGIKEPRRVKVWENDFAIELIITDLEEMELSIHASYCVWVGVCLSNNYEHKEVIAFRKKISDALYAKKRKYKRLNSINL